MHKTYTTTIDKNGMIFLNEELREALGLKLGDKVLVEYADGVATLTPYAD